MKILIVEDEPTLLEFLESVFLSCNHDVRAFVSGATAVEIMPAWQPELLLCDLSLPDVPGEEVAQVASALPRPARVLLMSGAMRRLESARPLAEAVLLKPFKMEDLMSLVEGSPEPSRRR